jgi:hypothetical protein
MTAKITPAAQRLMQEVQAVNHRAAMRAVDKPDGYGRHRAIQFDSRTSKWLVPAIEAMQDPRIASVDYEGKGRAVVTWVGDTRADRQDDYLLAYVVAVLRGEDDN